MKKLILAVLLMALPLLARAQVQLINLTSTTTNHTWTTAYITIPGVCTNAIYTTTNPMSMQVGDSLPVAFGKVNTTFTYFSNQLALTLQLPNQYNTNWGMAVWLINSNLNVMPRNVITNGGEILCDNVAGLGNRIVSDGTGDMKVWGDMSVYGINGLGTTVPTLTVGNDYLETIGGVPTLVGATSYELLTKGSGEFDGNLAVAENLNVGGVFGYVYGSITLNGVTIDSWPGWMSDSEINDVGSGVLQLEGLEFYDGSTVVTNWNQVVLAGGTMGFDYLSGTGNLITSDGSGDLTTVSLTSGSLTLGTASSPGAGGIAASGNESIGGDLTVNGSGTTTFNDTLSVQGGAAYDAWVFYGGITLGSTTLTAWPSIALDTGVSSSGGVISAGGFSGPLAGDVATYNLSLNGTTLTSWPSVVTDTSIYADGSGDISVVGLDVGGSGTLYSLPSYLALDSSTFTVDTSGDITAAGNVNSAGTATFVSNGVQIMSDTAGAGGTCIMLMPSDGGSAKYIHVNNAGVITVTGAP